MGDAQGACWAKCPSLCLSADGNHLLGAQDPACLSASCRSVCPDARQRLERYNKDYFLGAWGFDDGGYREYCGPWAGLAHVRRPDGLYKAVPRFSLYRWRSSRAVSLFL